MTTITEDGAGGPVGAVRCLEANLRHTGRMIAPAIQGELPV